MTNPKKIPKFNPAEDFAGGYAEDEHEKEEWGGWTIVSDMLDNPDEHGFYPTSECYKKLYDFVVAQKAKAKDEQKEKDAKICENAQPMYGHGGVGQTEVTESLAKAIRNQSNE